jgi:hypothetical protein
MEIRDEPQNWASPGLAKCYRSALLEPPSSMKNVSFFSNDRLNFKHPFWATRSREKGIFAAFTAP